MRPWRRNGHRSAEGQLVEREGEGPAAAAERLRQETLVLGCPRVKPVPGQLLSRHCRSRPSGQAHLARLIVEGAPPRPREEQTWA